MPFYFMVFQKTFFLSVSLEKRRCQGVFGQHQEAEQPVPWQTHQPIHRHGPPASNFPPGNSREKRRWTRPNESLARSCNIFIRPGMAHGGLGQKSKKLGNQKNGWMLCFWLPGLRIVAEPPWGLSLARPLLASLSRKGQNAWVVCPMFWRIEVCEVCCE